VDTKVLGWVVVSVGIGRKKRNARSVLRCGRRGYRWRRLGGAIRWTPIWFTSGCVIRVLRRLFLSVCFNTRFHATAASTTNPERQHAT